MAAAAAAAVLVLFACVLRFHVFLIVAVWTDVCLCSVIPSVFHSNVCACACVL